MMMTTLLELQLAGKQASWQMIRKRSPCLSKIKDK